jgi:phenylpyruvate tautomerase PptA (4-oxalocrotonate tautomerase family)
MPLVRISMLNHFSDARVGEINDAIHGGLVDAIQIEDWDYFHRVDTYEKRDFIFPDFKSQNFMIIEIHLFPGRSDEQKQQIFQSVCSRLNRIGIDENDVFIELIEQPNAHWGIAGKARAVRG